MKNSSTRFRQLFKSYTEGRITKDELREFWTLLEATEQHGLSDELRSLWEEARAAQFSLEDATWDHKMNRLIYETNTWLSETSSRQNRRRTSFFSSWAKVAAAILIFAIAGSLFWLIREKQLPELAGTLKNHVHHDISPGGNKAILTLADGSNILLDSVQNGKLAQQGNTKIIKLDNGELLYSDSISLTQDINSNPPNPLKKGEFRPNNYRDQTNTLRTPRGGQYQLRLPDGTGVWLNAASSIIFPPAFTGKERRVKITGEAYFEVAKNDAMPFIVNVNKKAEIKVLGTHFNINAYDDEAIIKTTLLEGSVQVSSSLSPSLPQSLIPGQRAIIDTQGKLSVTKADTTKTLAWKHGLFKFDSEDIGSIMKKIARWYDVEIVYEGGKPDIRLSGIISRNVNASNVLKMFELSGVEFTIEGRKVIIKEK